MITKEDLVELFEQQKEPPRRIVLKFDPLKHPDSILYTGESEITVSEKYFLTLDSEYDFDYPYLPNGLNSHGHGISCYAVDGLRGDWVKSIDEILNILATKHIPLEDLYVDMEKTMC